MLIRPLNELSLQHTGVWPLEDLMSIESQHGHGMTVTYQFAPFPTPIPMELQPEPQ